MPTYVLVRLSYPERKVCLVSCSFHVTKYATTPTNYVSSLHLKSKNIYLLNYSSHSKKILSGCSSSYCAERYSQRSKF